MDKAYDSRNLEGKRDRITDWGLGRTVDAYYSEHMDRPDLTKNSVVAEHLMSKPEIRAAIGKATVRPVDIQVYAYNRRRRQEEAADKMLVEGPNGRKLVGTIAHSVSRLVEHTNTIELLVPETVEIVQEMNRRALIAAKKGERISKDYKVVWQVVKTNLELMMKAVDMIKGDNSLQNIIKAQSITQNIIQGIDPQELPQKFLELLQHITCPKCGHGHWTKRDAIGAYAKYMGAKARNDIIDAEEAPPMPPKKHYFNDPKGRYWPGEYEARE